jgi:hypothetical protein
MRTVIPAHDPSQERDPASLATLSQAISKPAFGQHPLLRLQRTIGNQAVLRMLRDQGHLGGTPPAASSHAAEELTPVQIQAPVAPAIQTKLTVNEPGDEHEQEADRVAEQVMRMPALVHAPPLDSAAPVSLQSKCACGGTCDKCQANRKEEDHDHEELHRSPADASHLDQTTAPPIVEEVLRTPGEPLDPETRAFMEPRFDQDFGAVRIHADSTAAQSAESVNAQAYTVGNHVAFGVSKYSPSTNSGKALLAHELTHVVQQGRTAVVQCQPLVGQTPGSNLDPLSPNVKPPQQADEGLYFQMGFRGKKGNPVTIEKLLQWAETRIWEDAAGTGRPMNVISMLLRHEDEGLNHVWADKIASSVRAVQSSHEFEGSDAARNGWADLLNVELRGTIIEYLNQRAKQELVNEIKETLLTGRIPPGARLLTDPAGVESAQAKSKASPAAVTIPCGFGGPCEVHVGFTWGDKQITSIGLGSLDFEVTGHEGIYFEISDSDFINSKPFETKVIEKVAANTAGLAVVGSFIKGFLTAMASPLQIAAETGARVIDMATLAVAAGVKFTTGYDKVPFTCISSTCKNYSACLENDEKTEDQCKSDALVASLEEATIIIPLYRQGSQCVNGDAEACGAIAALSVGLVHGGLEKLSTTEFKVGQALSPSELENAAIREAVGRPLAGDPHIGQALERPKAHEEPHPTVKPAAPKSKAELEHIRALEKINRRSAAEFARSRHINPKQLNAELDTLSRDASNPAKVHVPSGEKAAKYDAEMETSENGEHHTYDRERQQNDGSHRWCRFSPEPGDCGVPVGPELDAVDSTLKNKAAGGDLDTAAANRDLPTRNSKLPSPAELEKSVSGAVNANVRNLDPTTNFDFSNRSLSTIAKELEERQKQLQAAGKGGLLPQVNNSIMELGATEFISRHPDLQTRFEALMDQAIRERNRGSGALYEEVTKFLSEGRMGARRPDTIEFRLDNSEVSITDSTMKQIRAKAVVHEFKTRFYGAAIRDILGQNGPRVSSFEHNPALGIHRPAR